MPIAILIGVVFDILDGRIARMTKTENEMGKQLDSLADLTTFGIAPAVLGYTIGLNSILDIIILTFYETCGMVRLARFNMTEMKGFRGLPITTGGIIYPVLLLIYTTVPGYVIIFYALSGLLMISDIKVKKF